ncbi:MAG: alpha-galactosidase, partial [Pseudomonadota bacterium]
MSLTADHAQLCVDVGGDWPRIVHIGAPIGDAGAMLCGPPRAHGLFDAGEPIPLFPDAARGWMGRPALSGIPGSWRFESVETVEDALSFRYRNPEEIRADILITARAPGVFALTMSVDVEIANGRDFGVTFPLPRHLSNGLRFGGRWAGEFALVAFDVGAGTAFLNRGGSRLSHDAFPGLVFGTPATDEDAGEALLAHLEWHGNFDAAVLTSRDGAPYLGFTLAADELAPRDGRIETPPLVIAWSDRGRNGLRIAMQDASRTHGRPATCAVQANSWEGVYFDHDLGRLKEMASAAAALGVERFVLDDGWFGRRTDDTRGLGDWTPRDCAYPDGLDPLIDHVRAAGMDFGLWVEPEMVSADSALFAAHPDWIVGRADQPLGRSQYGLDLTNPDGFRHICDRMIALTADPRIRAVKWDMNRDLPQAAGTRLAG